MTPPSIMLHRPPIYNEDYFVGISKHAKEANAKKGYAKRLTQKRPNAKEAKQEPPRWRFSTAIGGLSIFSTTIVISSC